MALKRSRHQSVELKLQFTTGGTGEIKDLEFLPRFEGNEKGLKYPNPSDVLINQSFKELFVHNLSSNLCVYSVLFDRKNELSITAIGGNGQKTVPAGFAVSHNAKAINRLRVLLSGPGVVEVVLFK